MKLKDLIAVINRGTLVCICDDMGPMTNVEKIEDISLINCINDLDRTIEQVYIDEDNSLTIILEDWKEPLD